MFSLQDGFDRDALLSQLDSTFFNDKSLPESVSEQCLMMLLQTSVAGSHEIKTCESLDNDQTIDLTVKV